MRGRNRFDSNAEGRADLCFREGKSTRPVRDWTVR